MALEPLLQEVLASFAVESDERFAVVAEQVMVLEQGPGKDDAARAWSRLARELHTLKGTAATAGLTDLAALAHGLESVIAPLLRAGAALPPLLADALLQVGDAWVARARAAAAGDDVPVADSVRAAVAAAATTTTAPTAATTAAAPAAATTTTTTTTMPAQPAGDDGEAGAWRVQSSDVLSFGRDLERVRELRLRLDDRVKDVDAALAAVERDVPREQRAALRATLQGVRRALVGDVEETGEVLAALEDGVKAICTLPVRTVVDALARAVRDLCRASGKQASLAVVGGDVAVDRRLLEALRGPLIQLVRNAVDHGVEPPALRRARGKHETATLTLRIELQGNLLFVEVADDGSGLDEDAIRAAAVARGVVSADDARALAPGDVHRLIFRQGLSTRSTVTETSGRGVGLDLVLSQVQALAGHVDVATVRGQGTRFLLHVPVEIGASALLMARCGDHLVGVPMAAVDAVVAVTPAALRTTRRATSLEHRDQLLPVLDLGALLGVRAPATPLPGTPVLVLSAAGRRCALLVDEVRGDRELVVRPLPKELEDVAAWQGVAVMARGELLLVVRPDWLVAHEETPLGAGGRRVLVVDDSLTARALHRTILEAGGFHVHLAGSVAAAEEHLRAGGYDAVVCDLHFGAAHDEGGGLSLLQRVRRDPETRGLAFVIVSAADDAAARKAGADLGVDAWLTKEECAHGRLLAQVNAVLGARSR